MNMISINLYLHGGSPNSNTKHDYPCFFLTFHIHTLMTFLETFEAFFTQNTMDQVVECQLWFCGCLIIPFYKCYVRFFFIIIILKYKNYNKYCLNIHYNIYIYLSVRDT